MRWRLYGWWVWISWKVTHPRCTFRGHQWGEDHRGHEVGVLYEAWVECDRCGVSVETYHVYGGQTPEGKRIGRPR